MRPAYCDESVWVPVADGLRQREWEVHTASEEGTLGRTDREQLAIATDNDWLLLTFDDDFLSLVERDGLDHAGIVYVSQTGKTIGDVVKMVDAHLAGRTHEDRTIAYL